MSQQHIDLWMQTADAFDQRYQALGDAHWAASSPCEGWTVKDVVDHAVGTQAGFAGPLVGASISEGAEWPAVRSAITESLQAEGALDGMTEGGPMGPMPKTMMFGIAVADLLMHTWDVARGAGLDESLPEAPVQASYMGLQKMPSDMMRAEGRFGPEVACADDADTQTKLLCYAGRQV